MHHSLWLRALSRALFVRRSSSSSKKHRSPTRRVRLGLEQLEDRITPSADPTSTALTGLVPPTLIYNSAGENASVIATVTDLNTGGGVSEGQVQFSIDGNNLGGPAPKSPTSPSPSTFTLNTTVPATYNVGIHTLDAFFSDPNSSLYLSSTGYGSLTIDQANSAMTVSETNSPVYNSGSETIDLKANITSTNGGTVNQGSVVFTVNGISSPPESVVNGLATDALVLPTASVLNAGNYSGEITAKYTDTATNDYAAANASSDVIIGAAATTTTITTPAVSSTYNSGANQAVTLTASVVNNNGGGAVNEGTVTFTVHNLHGTDVTATSGTVTNGMATATLIVPAGFATGSYSFGATYTDTTNGNGLVNYDSSTAGTNGTLTVNAATTQTTITPNLVTSPFSTTAQSVTLTADVTSTSGGTVSEGAVTFVVNGLTTTANVINGVATASLIVPANYAAGSYSISASYADPNNVNGTPNYDASTAATSGTLAIAPATTTTLNGANVSSTFNSTTPQTVTLSASVTSPGGVVNEGNVTFTVTNPNGADLTATGAVVNGEATATLTIPADFAAGSYTYNASYADIINANHTVNFASSTAATPGKLTVNAAATQTTISPALVISSFNTSAQTVTLTADVTSTDGGTVNEGAVTFIVTNPNGPNLTTTANVIGGVASASLTVPANFPAGSYSFSASYADITNANGNVNYDASTAATSGTLAIAPATTTTLNGANVSSTFNSLTPQTVTLSASVTSPGGVVNEGNVTFTVTNPNGANLIVTGAVVNGEATATLTIPADFAAGSYTYNASYADIINANHTVNFASSTATKPGTLTVNPASTETTLITSSLTSTFNSTTPQMETLVATVTSSNGGPINEGMVTFTVINPNGPNLTVSANVSNDAASTTLTLPAGFAAGTYKVTASYADSTNANNTVNYSASTASSPGTLTVNAASTQTFLTSPSVSSVFNDSTAQGVTLTASVTSSNGGIVNEGNVIFTLTNPNGASLTATGTVTGGTATATLSVPAGFAVGTYSFSASYADTNNANGVVNYNASSASTIGTLVVKTASTQTTISTTPVSSIYNSGSAENVTLVAFVTSPDGGTVNEGVVTFTVTDSHGPNLTTSAKVINGVATAIVTVPPGFPAGNYSFGASYADPANANGLLNYSASSATTPGTLFVVEATTTTLTATNVSSTFNSTTPQTITLVASVSSPNGGTVNEGNVTFTVTNPNGTDLTATGAVSNGSASATLTIPADFAAGSYKFNATYTDTLNVNNTTNYASSTTATPSTLTVNAATTATTITSPSVTSTFNSTTPQSVTLTASVLSADGGTVNKGLVTFTVTNPNGANLTTTATVTNGTATATLSIPAEFAAGSYSFSASYADITNANGNINFDPSSAATPGTLIVAQATTTTMTANVSSTFNSTTPQTVTLDATVTSPNGGVVNEGNVTFTVTNPNGADLKVTGAVVNGAVSATLTIPSDFAAGIYKFNASYTDTLNANNITNFASSTTATPSTLTVNAASTQTTITSTAVSSTFNSTTPQSVTLTADVTSATGGTVNEGSVTFTVVNPNGASLTSTANVINGTITTTLAIPAEFAAGSYVINASYTDSNNANGTPNYSGSTAATSGALTVNAASTTTSVTSSSVSSIFNSSTAQTVNLSATVTSTSGGTVNEGVVTFTVTNPNGANLTASGNVGSNGAVTATLTIPAGFAAGNYTFNASYVDATNANGKVNFDSSMAATPGTLTVQTAISQTSVVVSPSSITFSPNGQTVTATAQVVSMDGGTVNQGNVTFALNGVTPVTVAVNSNGQAAVTLQVPPGFAPGAYTLTASYADTTNANGKTSFAASSGAATLNVAPAPTTVAITQVFEVAGNGLVAELVTAQVTDAFGPVNGGVVQFNIDGHIVDSSVHSGQATGFVILPQAVVAVPEAFSASYTPPTSQFTASNDSVVALWTILNFVEPGGYVRFGPDGSQVVVVVFSDGVQFGLTYDSTGQHTGFEIGVQPGLLSV